MNKIVPLSPVLAIRILPTLEAKMAKPDFGFSGFRYRTCALRHNEIRRVNELLVRSAEDFVFYCEDHSWISEFIKRNRHFRIDSTTDRILTPTGGEFQVSRQRIVSFQRAAVGTD